LEDYVPNYDEEPVIGIALEHEEEKERISASEEHMHHMEHIELELPTDCAICMLVIVEPTQLPCKHIFCKECARTSMNFSWECPMCRSIPRQNFTFTVSEELKE